MQLLPEGDQYELLLMSYFFLFCSYGAPTKRPKTKRPMPKTSQLQKVPPHKVPPIKRPNFKRSQLQNVPSPKTSQPHNIPTPNRPKPQNVPSLKTSQLQNVPTPKGPNYKTSQALKRLNLLWKKSYIFYYSSDDGNSYNWGLSANKYIYHGNFLHYSLFMFNKYIFILFFYIIYSIKHNSFKL